MIALTAATRVFVALDPVDLRKSFSGLQGCVQQQLREDPLSGRVFVFSNRRHSRLTFRVAGSKPATFDPAWLVLGCPVTLWGTEKRTHLR